VKQISSVSCLKTYISIAKATHCLLEKSYPELTEVEYFSDGCGGPYKNFKNFLNLTYHHSDFGMKACWSFFATSHRKSHCDGIGSSMKQKLANASLAASASFDTGGRL